MLLIKKCLLIYHGSTSVIMSIFRIWECGPLIIHMLHLPYRMVFWPLGRLEVLTPYTLWLHTFKNCKTSIVDIDDLKENITNEIEKINNTLENKMVVLFSRQQDENASLRLNNQTLKLVHQLKYLGSLTIDKLDPEMYIKITIE